ncbi:tetratricopeptide repeat protein [Glycomyces terrestris]|nr:tetratricopeptide repeat protein [Glycomyces terrestris]
MIEPLSAATLGGLAVDTARATITKWVGARIASDISAGMRERPLKQGRPAKDQQTELNLVITRAVELTALELFPGQERLQKAFRRDLLKGHPRERPLVNGSDLAYLVGDVHEWVTRNDPPPLSQKSVDPVAHPYLSVLCRNIVAQFGFRAENNGTKNTILYPRWNRFWTTELLNSHNEVPLPAATDLPIDASPAWPRRFGTYRQLLADRTLTLEQLSPELLPDQYPHTVAAALTIALEHADRYEPAGLASLLLASACVLDPAGIPADLFTALQIGWDSEDDPEDEQGGADPALIPPRTITDTLARLHRLNLVDYDGTFVRVHALVQRTRRDQLDEQQMRTVVQHAAGALDAIWPEVENDPVRSAALRANLTALRGHDQSALFQGEAHPALFRHGTSLGVNGHVNDAHLYYQGLYALCDDLLGPDHSHTLVARNDLAYWRGASGDAAGAVSALAELVTDRLRVSGPDRLETLIARGNLATWKGEAGDAAGAADAFAELLTDFRRILGPDHPETLATRNNLASWRGRAGDAAGTVAAFTELLEDLVRVLGPDHPDTLIARGNLASWRGEAGDAQAAVTAFTELLEDLVRVLGPDHPLTLTYRGNLASLRGEVDDAPGAVAAFTELLEDLMRVLGPDHPDTLIARGNLAIWCGEAGDAPAAATAFAQLISDRLRVFGPDHLDTLATRANFAIWLGKAGDAAGAASALTDLLDDLERVLGPDHPLTSSTEIALTYWQSRS